MRKKDPTLAKVEVTAEHLQSRIKERQKGKIQKHTKKSPNKNKGCPDVKKMVKKATLSPFGDPPAKRVKRGHLLSEKRALIATNAFSRQNSVCLGSWLSLRSWIANPRSHTLSHPAFKYADKYEILWSICQCS